MSKLENLEEEFLYFLLKTFFRKDKSYFHKIVNYQVIQSSVELFINYYNNEDKINHTNHSNIIYSVFCENSIVTNEEILSLGISPKTFYRYRQKYLQVFRTYLNQGLLNEKVQS